MLSSSVVAARSDVERTLRSLIGRLNGADPSAKTALPADRAIACVLPDLETCYRANLRKGQVSRPVAAGGPEDGDVVFTVSSDDLLALAGGRLSLPAAVVTGKLKIDAGARDLLLLRRMF
ncbi:MAG: SCP2 sterol-binding domain-containing protein [Acidobacteria bacterium]|nr:SCP2 sterol-binding domain-containing protein [Acidobacteriota bacterium]